MNARTVLEMRLRFSVIGRLCSWFCWAAVATSLACAPRGPVAPPGPPPPVAGLGREIRIGVVEAASSVTLGSSGDYVITERATGRVLANGTNGAATISLASPGVYRVLAGATSTDVTEPVIVTSTTGIVTINGQQYRGRGEVRTNSAGSLAGINELPMEQYLYGVVPRELGPNLFPQVEAQKVQAIAARTYALSYMGRRAADGYDLRASTDDQVYGGYSAEHAVSNSAIDATRGIVLTHAGAMVIARYSSTSGGHTADNEESFAEGPVAYLRGVPDMPPSGGTAYVASLEAFKSSPLITDMRQPAAPFDLDRPRYHRWTFEWSAAELTSVISAFAGRNVGTVRAINVLERGRSGRIVSLEYVTDSGSFPAMRGAIRSSLRYTTSAGALANLPSTLFFVEPVTQSGSGGPTAIRVYGGGFGHGVGMAQVGAVLLARTGRMHEDILAHYYQGTELIKAY
jgi:stage II sporulation protein D